MVTPFYFNETHSALSRLVANVATTEVIPRPKLRFAIPFATIFVPERIKVEWD